MYVTIQLFCSAKVSDHLVNDADKIDENSITKAAIVSSPESDTNRRPKRTIRQRKHNDMLFYNRNDESNSEDKIITAKILLNKSKSSKHFKRNFDLNDDESTESR